MHVSEECNERFAGKLVTSITVTLRSTVGSSATFHRMVQREQRQAFVLFRSILLVNVSHCSASVSISLRSSRSRHVGNGTSTHLSGTGDNHLPHTGCIVVGCIVVDIQSQCQGKARTTPHKKYSYL